MALPLLSVIGLPLAFFDNGTLHVRDAMARKVKVAACRLGEYVTLHISHMFTKSFLKLSVCFSYVLYYALTGCFSTGTQYTTFLVSQFTGSSNLTENLLAALVTLSVSRMKGQQLQLLLHLLMPALVLFALLYCGNLVLTNRFLRFVYRLPGAS